MLRQERELYFGVYFQYRKNFGNILSICLLLSENLRVALYVANH